MLDIVLNDLTRILDILIDCSYCLSKSHFTLIFSVDYSLDQCNIVSSHDLDCLFILHSTFSILISGDDMLDHDIDFIQI